MDREAAVEFYSRLMRNLQLSVHRFRVSDFPEVDMGLWQSFGFSIRENYLPAEEQIAGQTIYMAEDMFLWRYILMRLPQDESLLLAGPYLNEGVTDQTIMAIMEETIYFQNSRRIRPKSTPRTSVDRPNTCRV